MRGAQPCPEPPPPSPSGLPGPGRVAAPDASSVSLHVGPTRGLTGAGQACLLTRVCPGLAHHKRGSGVQRTQLLLSAGPSPSPLSRRRGCPGVGAAVLQAPLRALHHGAGRSGCPGVGVVFGRVGGGGASSFCSPRGRRRGGSCPRVWGRLWRLPVRVLGGSSPRKVPAAPYLLCRGSQARAGGFWGPGRQPTSASSGDGRR